MAKLATQHLIDRSVVGFTSQIPKRHFDAADAARLPGVPAELFDLAKNLIDVARILAEDTALEKERVSGTRSVANFAQTVDALVGIDANEWTGHRRTGHHGNAQLRNFQIGRAGILVDVLHGGFECVAGPQTRHGQAPGCRPQKSTPVRLSK